MTHDFKLLIDELKYKLNLSFNRITTLELELQNKTVHIQKLQEELGFYVPINSEEGKEKKSNGKS